MWQSCPFTHYVLACSISMVSFTSKDTHPAIHGVCLRKFITFHLQMIYELPQVPSLAGSTEVSLGSFPVVRSVLGENGWGGGKLSTPLTAQVTAWKSPRS